MARRWRLNALLAAGLMALLAAAAVAPVSAQGQEPLRIHLATTDLGYECLEGCDHVQLGESLWEPVVTVSQGTLVELTFSWQHVGYIEEEHIMLLEGYGLEWDLLDFHSREASALFIADQPGTFRFKCDLDCELHDYLQRGHLKVSRGGGDGGMAEYTPTNLSVTPSSWVNTGDTTTLTMSLRDPEGVPVSKADVHVLLDVEIGSVQAPMEIGVVKTDENGTAFFEYHPTVGAPQHVLTAQFDGAGIYDASEEVLELRGVGLPPPAYTTPPVGLQPFWDWGPRVLAVGTAGVWMVLAFVLYQMFGIFLSRRGG